MASPSQRGRGKEQRKVMSAKAVHRAPSPRVVLVVVDLDQVGTRALFFACRWALKSSCRIALLHVRPCLDRNPLLVLGQLVRQENRAFSESHVQQVSRKVAEWGCKIPACYMREGELVAQIQDLLSEKDHKIALIVMSAQTFTSASGGLTRLMSKKKDSKRSKEFRPFIVVPDTLSYDDIERLI